MIEKFYVYEWITPCDLEMSGIIIPANSVFYVGKGKGNRAYSHIDERKVCNWLKKTAVDRIKEKTGSNPIVHIAVDCLSETTAFDIETEKIRVYGRIIDGTGYLVNLTDGGEGTSGYKHSSELRDHWSVIRKGKPSGRLGVKRPGIGGRKKGTKWSNEERILQMRHRQLSTHPNKGKIWCTNGIDEIYCTPEQIPYGYVRGKIKLPPNNSGKVWCNNGELETYCFKEDIPNGYSIGRLKKSTNGKKGLLWYTNGSHNKQFRLGEEPEGWLRGRSIQK